MSFLSRSSPLAGGKTISSAESMKHYIELYYDALLHVSTPSGILSLVRLIRRDSRLEFYDCEWLCDYAADFFSELTGYDMDACL